MKMMYLLEKYIFIYLLLKKMNLDIFYKKYNKRKCIIFF